MTVLCATITEMDAPRVLAAIEGAAAVADLFEVRLDAMEDPDPERILAGTDRPLLFACRAPSDEGRFGGSERERIALLKRAIDAGAAWVDVEFHAADRIGDRKGTKIIVSHHDFEGTPPDLGEILDRLTEHEPDIVKLVTTAHRPEDVLRMLLLLRKAKRPLAAHTMGAAGLPGRILAARFGSAIVFGAARAGATGVAGQPVLRDLVADYRLDRDLSAAPVFLLIGGSLAHSVSPRMVNRALAAEEIPGLYVPWEGEDPTPVLAALEGIGARGVAVTIPFKESVVSRLGRLDPSAERTGAVNTIVVTGEGLVGHNTDLGGALDALKTARPDLSGCRALVVGAGGAARAIVRGLVDEGAEVRILNRTPEKAERLAAEIGAQAVSLEDLDRDSIDVIVNATPVGQWPEVSETPVPKRLFRPGQVVFDAVYNPNATRLLEEAGEAGAKTVPGISMLARQAARQLDLWLGRAVPAERLEEEGALALRLRDAPIVLVGMRGAGKSTVGRIVADRLGREFVDLDEVIETRAQKSIPEIFAEGGESYFRMVERQSFFTAIRRGGIVLATGGGLPGSRIVRATLRESGSPVLYLSVPAGILAGRVRGSERPSLGGGPPEEEIPDLLEERDPLYREVATHVVDAGEAAPEVVADRLLDALFL